MKIPTDQKWKWLIAGILFAILWPSASTATKWGLQVAQPLVIAEVRFAMAGCILLFISHIVLKNGCPKRRMETACDLWITEHFHLFGLLCGGYAKHNGGHWRSGSSYQSCFH
jgi:drug/metabolite transporter (DMT)-like permease